VYKNTTYLSTCADGCGAYISQEQASDGEGDAAARLCRNGGQYTGCVIKTVSRPVIWQQ